MLHEVLPPSGTALPLALVLTFAAISVPTDAQSTRVTIPDHDPGIEFLEARRASQERALTGSSLLTSFRFEDRLASSGIHWRHQATEDATSRYKMVHYDHGNGVAAADVDGDGHLDLYFVSQIGPNALFLGDGEGRFRETTAEAGAGLSDRVSVTAAFADPDNDGDPDLFVTTVNMGNVLFRNDGEGSFEDVTEAAGLDHRGHSSGAVFFDYDNDGLLDLLVTNIGRYTTSELGTDSYYIGVGDAFQGHLHPDRTERSLLYRNLGNLRFEEVSERTGLVDTSWSGDALPADLDGDGYPEVYVLNMQGDDHYWDNVEGKRFADRSRETFPRTPWGAMGGGFFDYDNDGDLDLYLTDMHSDMSQGVRPTDEKLKSEMLWEEPYLQGGDNNIFGNAFFENRDDGFREISDLIGAENYWPWGFSVGDLNADGWQDVVVAASMSYPWRYGLNSVLLNDRGQIFRDAETVLGVEPRSGGTKIAYFDLDCSGADRDHEHCAGHEGTITVWGNLGTRSSVLLDLDEDGDLDIVTQEFHAPPQILVSDLAQGRDVRFLQVRLSGRRSNRDGLGAWVSVRTGETTQTRYHDGRSGYLSQSSMPLYFGLGDASEVESIEVRWPSGTVQTLPSARIGATVEIVEADED